MKESYAIVNALMVEVFNDILTIEESSIKEMGFTDVSITEIHTVEAIGLHIRPTTSGVAKKLGVTVGTLTVAANNLVSKGYAERIRSEDDRRVVRLCLTQKGRLLYRIHDKFHREVIKATIQGLDEDEERVLVSALANVHKYLTEVKLAPRRK